jgi:hypothetical protein
LRDLPISAWSHQAKPPKIPIQSTEFSSPELYKPLHIDQRDSREKSRGVTDRDPRSVKYEESRAVDYWVSFWPPDPTRSWQSLVVCPAATYIPAQRGNSSKVDFAAQEIHA